MSLMAREGWTWTFCGWIGRRSPLQIQFKLTLDNIFQSQYYSKLMPSVFQSLQDMDEQRVKMIQVKFNLLIAFSIFNNNHFKYTVPIIKTAHPELQNVLNCFLATLYLQSGHLKFKQSQMVCKRTYKVECCLSQK